jgi:hypothetical protein
MNQKEKGRFMDNNEKFVYKEVNKQDKGNGII